MVCIHLTPAAQIHIREWAAPEANVRSGARVGNQ